MDIPQVSLDKELTDTYRYKYRYFDTYRYRFTKWNQFLRKIVAPTTPPTAKGATCTWMQEVWKLESLTKQINCDLYRQVEISAFFLDKEVTLLYTCTGIPSESNFRKYINPNNFSLSCFLLHVVPKELRLEFLTAQIVTFVDRWKFLKPVLTNRQSWYIQVQVKHWSVGPIQIFLNIISTTTT